MVDWDLIIQELQGKREKAIQHEMKGKKRLPYRLYP